MRDSVNIIIPAVKVDEEVLKCLREISKIKYSNFFVTLVLDLAPSEKLPKLKYKVNKIISGKINMSKKRNIAAKKYKSKFIAFLDSDAYPNENWLKMGTKYLKEKKLYAQYIMKFQKSLTQIVRKILNSAINT